MQSRSRALFFLVLILCQNLQVFCKTNADAENINDDTANLTSEAPKSTNADIVGETHEFQAEIGRLMDIIINSLYTNKDVFLREVISNASDALDKIRFLAVADPESLKAVPELFIRLEFDNDAKTVTIYDSGVGMTKQDLINNLGTIAKSGTTNFVEALAQGQNLNLIGQFGVGFYSTFLAGNKVTVITKNNADDQYIWESSAASSFVIAKDPEGNTLGRGTKIIIHLKQDSYEYCDEHKLKELAQKYSEFINFPIYIKVQKSISKEVPADEENEVVEKKPDDDGLTIKDDDEAKPKTKTVTEQVWETELVNDNKAIWLRPKEDITKEDYNNFYNAIAKDGENPLTYTHFKAEGEVDFKSILFIPSRSPPDLYENYYAKVSTLKLYVRRVLINEKFEDLLPKYLNFIKGVIDSDDLPINVSRESLQQVKMLKVISRKLVKKTLEMIKDLADARESDDSDEDEYESDSDETDTKRTENAEETEEERQKREEKEKKREAKLEKYKDFYREFGKNIKLGIIEDAANRNKLAQLSRWYTTHNSTELSSLDEYISRMKPKQEHIYYIGGENRDVLLKHPTIQALRRKNYEVLLLDDPIDEFCIQNVYDYEKKMLVNVAKGTFIMPSEDDDEKITRMKLKKLKKMYEPLTTWWKTLAPEKLESVTVSERLVSDPCIVVGSVYGYSAQMERIQKAQAYGPSNPMSNSKRILEINPSHPVVKELLKRVQDNPTPDAEIEELAVLLYEAALISAGYALADAQEFASRFYKIFNPVLGIAKDAEIEEIHVEIDENEVDEPEITPMGGSYAGEGYSETITPNGINIDFGEPPQKNRKPNTDRKPTRDEADNTGNAVPETPNTDASGESHNHGSSNQGDSETRTTRIPDSETRETQHTEQTGNKETHNTHHTHHTHSTHHESTTGNKKTDGGDL